MNQIEFNISTLEFKKDIINRLKDKSSDEKSKLDFQSMIDEINEKIINLKNRFLN